MKEVTKKNLKNSWRGIVFVLLFMALFCYLSLVFTPTRDDAVEGLSNNMEYAYRGENKSSIDLIFVGNSDVARGVNPIQIWRDYGITACTIGPSASSATEIYNKLMDVTKYQTPKMVVVEVDCLYPANNKYYKMIKEEEQRVLSERQSSIKDEISEIDDKTISGLSFYWPLMKYHDRWSELDINEFFDLNGRFKYSAKGYMYTNEAIAFPYGDEYMAKTTNKGAKFKKDTEEYFEKIYSYCKQNNVKMSLLAIPSGSSWTVEKHNTTVKLAEKYELDFVDYNTNPELIDGFDWSTDTKDAGNHLNYSGATKLTKAYMDYLIPQFNLEKSQMSKEETAIWNEDCDIFYNEIKK